MQRAAVSPWRVGSSNDTRGCSLGSLVVIGSGEVFERGFYAPPMMSKEAVGSPKIYTEHLPKSFFNFVGDGFRNWKSYAPFAANFRLPHDV